MIAQSLFSILQWLTHPVNLPIKILVGAISISSFFSFWKLDYFSDMNCLKNPLSDMISRSSSTQLITSDIRVRYWPRMYSLNINSIPLGEISTKVFQYVCYIIWESHCTKIIVARLLKRRMLYICIDESVWYPNTEPKFFRTRFLKRLRPVEKFIFQIMHFL